MSGRRRRVIAHPGWCVPGECEFDLAGGAVEGFHVGPAAVFGTADGTGVVSARLAQLLAEEVPELVEVRLEVTERTLPAVATVPAGLAFGPVADVCTTADLSPPQARELAEMLLEYAAAAEIYRGGS